MIFEIGTDKMRFSFSALGGELISAATSDGFEYIWQGDGNYWEKHAPLLFPICGRLKNSKYSFNKKEYELGCHGFLSNSLMEISKISDNNIIFSLSDSESTRAVFPFPFKLTVSYEAENTALHIKSTVENTGKTELPFMFGAHPGFNLPLDNGISKEDYFIDFGCNECTIHGLDEEKSFVSQNDEKYYFKNGLFKIDEAKLAQMGTAIFSGVSDEVKLFSPRGKRGVKINYSEEFKYFCVWKFPSEYADFICLEPWSGIPGNGINDEILETRSSMIRLKPNESKTFNYSITFI